MQDAFHDDPRVFTLSVREAGRWLFSGAAEDRAGRGRAARDIPVPPWFNDSETDHVLHHAILPIARRLRPKTIMPQRGTDALEDDPLARPSLSNTAHRAVGGADRSRGAAAHRARRGRVQSVVRGALLGGRVGDAERACQPGAAAGGGRGGAAGPRLASRGRSRAARTPVHDAARCAAAGPVRAEVRQVFARAPEG
ncbi:hypothetical protein GCM10010964_39910 [Caldovatus sediminis]|uniref:Histone deacetylase domain-containing protein n=1 Tax=Caldovatus sediminis TaxID=2041189 RepID=A0A8J2ZEW8_9PROT|nr:hypothetical protein GCM10010964_39910 [Caldovatus sediminis]